jgi:integrase
MPRRRQNTRVLGPYPYRGKFRIFLCDEGGAKTAEFFSTEKEANRVKAALQAKLSQELERTIEEALDAYQEYMRNVKHNKPSSVQTTTTRLQSFFEDRALPLVSLTPKHCQRYYESLAGRVSERTGKPPSVDSHRNILAEARTFLNWCIKPQKWLKQNPLAEVAGHGKRQHGKPQLRIDEARKLRAVCHEKAAQDDDGAVAVLLGMLMGLRAGEIVSRTARDVDDEGRILWIDDNAAIAFSPKTQASRRPVQVWEEVRPYLLARVKDKLPGALLFQAEGGGAHWRDWVRKQTRRLCKEAHVPVVCAHSLRGFAATLNLLSGVALPQVAAALGHESPSTTLQSYAAAGTQETLAAQHAQALLGPIKTPGKASK